MFIKFEDIKINENFMNFSLFNIIARIDVIIGMEITLVFKIYFNIS